MKYVEAGYLYWMPLHIASIQISSLDESHWDYLAGITKLVKTVFSIAPSLVAWDTLYSLCPQPWDWRLEIYCFGLFVFFYAYHFNLGHNFSQYSKHMAEYDNIYWGERSLSLLSDYKRSRLFPKVIFVTIECGYTQALCHLDF